MRAAPAIAVSAAIALAALAATPLSGQRLDGGSFVVEATNNPSNQNVLVSGTIPVGVGATVGRDLIISLRDATRPEQVCPDDGLGGISEGCLVVDWPAMIPDPEPFPNRVTLDSTGPPLTLHLKRNFRLEAQPHPPFG